LKRPLRLNKTARNGPGPGIKFKAEMSLMIWSTRFWSWQPELSLFNRKSTYIKVDISASKICPKEFFNNIKAVISSDEGHHIWRKPKLSRYWLLYLQMFSYTILYLDNGWGHLLSLMKLILYIRQLMCLERLNTLCITLKIIAFFITTLFFPLYTRVGILLTCGKYLYGRTIPLRREVWYIILT